MHIYWIYHQTSDIRCTLCNKIVDHLDVVGASPVGAAPTTSSFFILNWMPGFNGQRQLQGETRNQAPRKLFMLYRTENKFFAIFSNFKHCYIKKFYWSSHIFHWSSHFFISRGPEDWQVSQSVRLWETLKFWDLVFIVGLTVLCTNVIHCSFFVLQISAWWILCYLEQCHHYNWYQKCLVGLYDGSRVPHCWSLGPNIHNWCI